MHYTCSTETQSVIIKDEDNCRCRYHGDVEFLTSEKARHWYKQVLEKKCSSQNGTTDDGMRIEIIES